MPAQTAAEVLDRWSMPDENGCRVWLGRLSNSGYGVIKYRDGARSLTKNAHSVALTLAKGPRPKGLVAQHTCTQHGAPINNRACVNPDHLRWGTQSTNLTGRTVPLRKFTCDTCSEPYTGFGKGGKIRGCRSCRNRRAVEWQAANRDKVNARRRERAARTI